MPREKETRPGDAAQRREAGLVPVTVWVPAERKAEVLLLARKMVREAQSSSQPTVQPPATERAELPRLRPSSPASLPLPTSLPLPPLFTPPPLTPHLPPTTSPAPGQDEPAPEPRKLEIDDQDVVKREEILRMEAMKMEKLTRMRRLAAKLRKKAPPPP